MRTARMILALLAPLAAPALLPAPAFADETTTDGARQETTRYEFEDDLVAGGLIQPGLEVLRVRRRGERESLIRVRTQYVVELLQSAEQL